jgi:hypothetical protein
MRRYTRQSSTCECGSGYLKHRFRLRNNYDRDDYTDHYWFRHNDCGLYL